MNFRILIIYTNSKKHFLPPYFPPVCHLILTLVTNLLSYIIPNYAFAIVTFLRIHLNMGWENPLHAPVVDRGPKMETVPHPRDFMGPKWQDRVWSGDIKSGVCKIKCSVLRLYATISAKRSHISMVGSGCGCLSKTIIPPIIFIKKVSMERLKHVN